MKRVVQMFERLLGLGMAQEERHSKVCVCVVRVLVERKPQIALSAGRVDRDTGESAGHACDE